MYTFTGRKIDINEFKKEDVDLLDIATSIARQRRYAGHTALPWSVGQHLILCVMLAELSSDDEKLKPMVFLHDVEETWCQDIIYDIKRRYTLGIYDKTCEKVSKVVYDFFGFGEEYNSGKYKKMIHIIDRVAYHFEASQLISTYEMSEGNFSDEEKELITLLVTKGFQIPIDLINMDEDDVRQNIYEILQTLHSEKMLGSGLSSEIDEENKGEFEDFAKITNS